jgi:UrcA family protein
MKRSVYFSLGVLPHAFILVGCLEMGAANLARAADPTHAQLSVRVSLRDLDLTKPEGTATLYRRIEYAARAVCSPYEGRPLAQYAIWRRCFTETVESAVAKVDNVNLAAYHLDKTQRKRPTAQATNLSIAAVPAR